MVFISFLTVCVYDLIEQSLFTTHSCCFQSNSEKEPTRDVTHGDKHSELAIKKDGSNDWKFGFGCSGAFLL